MRPECICRLANVQVNQYQQYQPLVGAAVGVVADAGEAELSESHICAGLRVALFSGFSTFGVAAPARRAGRVGVKIAS